MEKIKIGSLSAGVSSFIACYLEKDTIDRYIYIDIDDHHPDNLRFLRDCEKVLGKKVEILKSEYGSVENCIRTAGVIKLPNHFAPCTAWLKKRVLKEFELKLQGYEITYVMGFDVDEKHRAKRLNIDKSNIKYQFPLIERELTKEDAHAICEKLGIKRPKMYDLGYSNNNCIGCVKGGMGYWNKIRIDFPDVFEKRARLERDIGYHLLKECYLDELDENRGNMQSEIMQECSLFCMLALNEENKE